MPSQPTRSKPESDATLAEYRESMPPGLARRAVTREQVAEAVSTNPEPRYSSARPEPAKPTSP